MIWKLFSHYWLLWGESTGQWWFSSHIACYVELWCFLWYYLEQAVEETVNLLMIWDAMILVWHQCNFNATKLRTAWLCDSLLQYILSKHLSLNPVSWLQHFLEEKAKDYSFHVPSGKCFSWWQLVNYLELLTQICFLRFCGNSMSQCIHIKIKSSFFFYQCKKLPPYNHAYGEQFPIDI